MHVSLAMKTLFLLALVTVWCKPASAADFPAPYNSENDTNATPSSTTETLNETQMRDLLAYLMHAAPVPLPPVAKGNH
jgi:hypothetical protein